MSECQLREWMTFFEICPFGPERDNWHAALTASTIANIHRQKGRPAIKMSEFMYMDIDTKRAQETKAFISGLKSLAKKKDGVN